MEIPLVNEGNSLPLEDLVKKFPEHSKNITGIVLFAATFDSALIKLLKYAEHQIGSEAKVMRFLYGCLVKHRNFIWGMLKMLLISESPVDGFMYLKHNLEYVAVFLAVVDDIGVKDWREVETEHLYNMKSIIELLKKHSDKNFSTEWIAKFKELGVHHNVAHYFERQDSEFQTIYGFANALSHPNYYTTMSQDFSFVESDAVTYLIQKTQYLQTRVAAGVQSLLVKLSLND